MNNQRKDISIDKFYGGKGIGPVSQVIIPSQTDDNLVKEGASLFQSNCTTCHNINGTRMIGPGLSGITNLRTPEWIMNMMLNPIGMTQQDSLAKGLLSVYMSQMSDNNLTKDQARSIYEFLRTIK